MVPVPVPYHVARPSRTYIHIHITDDLLCYRPCTLTRYRISYQVPSIPQSQPRVNILLSSLVIICTAYVSDPVFSRARACLLTSLGRRDEVRNQARVRRDVEAPNPVGRDFLEEVAVPVQDPEVRRVQEGLEEICIDAYQIESNLERGDERAEGVESGEGEDVLLALRIQRTRVVDLEGAVRWRMYRRVMVRHSKSIIPH